jgi:hypothetical protein
MERLGRTLERTVQALERCWSPEQVEIHSPDYLPDRVTGESREVDVSLRYKIGTVPILIIVECRDRQDTQDVTWMEQLAKKRDDVNASRAVAVSSSGFTGPAVIKAKHEGIELRTVEELTLTDISHWCRADSMTTIQPCAEIQHVTLTLSEHLDIGAALRDENGELALDRQVFFSSVDDAVSLRRIWQYAAVRSETFSTVPKDGTRVTKTLRCACDNPDDRFEIRFGGQTAVVLAITFVADLWHVVTASPPAHIYSYVDPEGAGVHVIDCRFEVGGTGFLLSTQRHLVDKNIKMLVRREPGT